MVAYIYCLDDFSVTYRILASVQTFHISYEHKSYYTNLSTLYKNIINGD